MKNPFLVFTLAALFVTQYEIDTTETVSDVFANCPAGIEKRVLIEKHGRKLLLYVCKAETVAPAGAGVPVEVEPLPDEGAL